LNFAVTTWPGEVQENAMQNLTKAGISYFKYLIAVNKPSAKDFIYKVNLRHMLSTIFGVIDLMPRFKSNRLQLGQIFIHEACRATLDRQFNPANKQILFNELVDLTCECFKLKAEHVRLQIDRPAYSYIKMDYTEMYTKMDSEKEEMDTIFEFREIYNQQNYRNPMKVTLFSFVLDNVIIVSRSLKQPLAGNIMLANDGCGALQIALLALLINKLTPKEFSSLPDSKFTKEKWQNDLKQVMY
jgi:hypothetical protein